MFFKLIFISPKIISDIFKCFILRFVDIFKYDYKISKFHYLKIQIHKSHISFFPLNHGHEAKLKMSKHMKN